MNEKVYNNLLFEGPEEEWTGRVGQQHEHKGAEKISCPHWRSLIQPRGGLILRARVIFIFVFALVLSTWTFGIVHYMDNYTTTNVGRVASSLRVGILNRSLDLMDVAISYQIMVAKMLELPFDDGTVKLPEAYPSFETFAMEVAGQIRPSFTRSGSLTGKMEILQMMGFMLDNGMAVQFSRDFHGELCGPRCKGKMFLAYSNSSFLDSMSRDIAWNIALIDASTGHPIEPVRNIQAINYVAEDSNIRDAFQLAPHENKFSLVLLRGGLRQLFYFHRIHSDVTGLKGILYSSSSLYNIEKLFMNPSLMGGTMYIVDQDEHVLAVTDDVVIVKTNVTGPSGFLRASEVADSAVAGAQQYLNNACPGEKLCAHSVAAENVRIQNRLYYIDSAPLPYAKIGLDLAAVIVMERHPIMGRVDSGNRRSTFFISGLSMAVFLITIVLVWVVTHLMLSATKLKTELSAQLEAKERAEAVVESSRLFLANLSHDLRTPMAGIIGLLEVLGFGDLSPEQAEIVNQIASTAKNLESTLNSILDLTQVEMGRLTLDARPFNIRELLENLVDLFSVETMARGTEIALELPDHLPERVIGDPMRCGQVFCNLLSNSIKYTEQGHILIRGSTLYTAPREASRNPRLMIDTVGSLGAGTRWRGNQGWWMPSIYNSSSCSQEVQQPGIFHSNSLSMARSSRTVTLLFEVSDTGKKITKGQEEAIFQNFVLLPEKDSRYGSTAFGLGIVRSLVELMGGTIHIVDKPGSPGSTFIFTLRFLLEPPCSSEHDQQQAAPLQQLPTIPIGHLPGHNSHVVLAMPLTVGNTLAARWLSSHGATVTQALTLEAAAMSLRTAAEKAREDSGEGAREGDKASKHHFAVIIDIELIPGPQDEYFGEGGLFVPQLQGLREILPASGWEGEVLNVVFAVKASTPAAIQCLVKAAGCRVLRTPFHASRLATVLPNLPLSAQSNNRSQGQLPVDDLAVDSSSDASTGGGTGITQPGSLTGNPTAKVEEVASTSATIQPDTNGALSGCYSSAPGRANEEYSAPARSHSGLSKPDSSEPGSAKREESAAGGSQPSCPHQGPTCLPSPPLVSEPLPVPPPHMRAASRLPKPAGVASKLPKPAEVASKLPKPAGATSKLFKPAQSKPPRPEEGATRGTGIKNKEPSETAVGLPGPSSASGGISQKSVPAVKGQQRPLTGVRILLVEDTPIMAKVAKMHLEKLGGTVTISTDGQQAIDAMCASYDREPDAPTAGGPADLEATSAGPPPPGRLPPGSTLFDFVLMDCQMPVVDGYDATREIRRMDGQRRCHTPIVALTAHAMESDKKKCLDCGMDDYLVKPLKPGLLLEILKNLNLLTKRE